MKSLMKSKTTAHFHLVMGRWAALEQVDRVAAYLQTNSFPSIGGV